MKIAIVNLVGVMPDGVTPDKAPDCENCNPVFIYYRTDGDLYLYDSILDWEFNLFKLET
jgi:hypothetical protein